MGLELRRKKDGTLIKHWFGAYTDENGKRNIRPLEEPLPKNIPKSLREEGDVAFEISRAKALKELEDFKAEARMKGRADHLTEKLIEKKTGRGIEYVKLAELPAKWRAVGRVEPPSEKHLKWCDSVFKRFIDVTPCVFLYEVQPKHIKAFLETVRKDHTRKTERDMTGLLRSAFRQLLPAGLPNPCDGSIRRKKAGTAVEGATIGRRPLTVEELVHLYETARPDPMLYGLTVCAACTGMRIGDVCHLRWQSVDLKNGWVRVTTSKTGVAVEIPIFDKLREVLESALANKKEGDVYVFPEAARMSDGVKDPADPKGKRFLMKPNHNGIIYRGKTLFARAFASRPKKTLSKKVADKPVCLNLADVFIRVSNAVSDAGFPAVKRDRILDSLTRYAKGQSYRTIEAETGRQRGQTSEDLHDAEKVSGLTLRQGASVKTGRDLKTLIGDTQQKRDRGCHKASLLGWHNLRGTFVVMALDGGIPQEMVMRCTGHTTARLVMDHYYNPTREHTRKAMERMPPVLTGADPLDLPEADPVAHLAEQLKKLTTADKARLAKMIKM
jgi:integrase